MCNELATRRYNHAGSIHIVLALSLCSLILFSCSSTHKATSPTHEVEQALLQQYAKWQGAPYRLGGFGLDGVDCSAFVMIVYRDAFGIDIPRTTADQITFGNRVNPRRLRIGDLVFFQTGRRTLHVGILLRDGRFMHASTSSGVMISHLGEPYWRERFLRVQRILN